MITEDLNDPYATPHRHDECAGNDSADDIEAGLLLFARMFQAVPTYSRESVATDNAASLTARFGTRRRTPSRDANTDMTRPPTGRPRPLGTWPPRATYKSAQQVFSDWPLTVAYFSNCMDRE